MGKHYFLASALVLLLAFLVPFSRQQDGEGEGVGGPVQSDDPEVQQVFNPDVYDGYQVRIGAHITVTFAFFCTFFFRDDLRLRFRQRRRNAFSWRTYSWDTSFTFTLWYDFFYFFIRAVACDFFVP